MDGTWQIGGRHGWPPQIKERLALQPGTGMAWKNRKMLACVVRSGTTTILGINGAGHCSSATNSMKKKQYVVYRNGEKERSRGAAPCHWPLCLCGLVSWGPRRSGRRAIIRRPRPHRPRRRTTWLTLTLSLYCARPHVYLSVAHPSLVHVPKRLVYFRFLIQDVFVGCPVSKTFFFVSISLGQWTT